MVPYFEPLLPGQAFSFVEPLYALYLDGEFSSIYLPMKSKAEYDKCEAVKTVISPTQRLIVQDNAFVSVDGEWRVPTWLPDEDCALSFGRRVDASILRRYKSWLPADFEVSKASLAVTNVGWPEPTPESLMIQVRCLSRWIGPPIDHHGHPNPIMWRQCQRLRNLPLETGVKLAIDWLREGHYLSDPAAALRERGFDV